MMQGSDMDIRPMAAPVLSASAIPGASSPVPSQPAPTPAPGSRPGAGGTPALRVSEVTRAYRGQVAVDRASFDVLPGEVVTLLGPSGCGKSTLLRSIAGIDRLDGGEIAIGGKTVASHASSLMLPPEKRDVGMVFQSYALWPHMTIQANVEYPLRRRGISAKDRRRRAQDALASVHLSGLEKRYPGELSGGQQQRVSLARAIVGDPKILLMDEPLSNLDAQLRDAMRVEIKRVQLERHLSVVYVTHDQQEALALSDRIIVMRTGHILQEGHPEQIYTNPASAYAARFLGASNELSGVLVGNDQVRLPDGSLLTCTPTGAVHGDRVTVVFRPSAVRLSEPGQVDAAGDPHTDELVMTVEQSAFLGTGYEVELRLSTGELITAATADPPPGQQVAVTVRPAYAYAVES